MRKDALPRYQTAAYLESLLKTEGEPTYDAYTFAGFQIGADGSCRQKWYAVSRWSCGQAWCEEFESELECLVWLISGEWECWLSEDIDKALEELWDAFGEYTIDEMERTEEPFLRFVAGTKREDIWHWFDQLYSKGVHALLYGEDDPEQEKQKSELEHALAKFYAEAIEDKTAYVCFALIDCDWGGIHTDHMQVFRSVMDVAQWWLDEEAILEDQGMRPRDEDRIDWRDIAKMLREGHEEITEAVYAWHDDEFDPMNCIQITVKKSEIIG
jgi:hypothetical protein